MSSQSRRLALESLVAARGGRPLVTYVTSRRPNLTTMITGDAFPRFYEHLKRVAPAAPIDEIDVFIMSFGGDVTVPLPLIYLIREYARAVNVLVPAECFSAATMIALGADQIVMTPLGQLTPIDPTVNHPMNPASNEIIELPALQDGTKQRRLVGVEVEQIFSYLSLARDKAEITNDHDFARVFEKLADFVHPLTLGEVHRIHTLIRLLARRLLGLHSRSSKEIEAIVGALTEKLYTHGYRISRFEAARDLKLPVTNPDAPTELAMMNLRAEYAADGKMDEPFNLVREAQSQLPAGGAPQAGATVDLALNCVFIESAAGQCIFTAERSVTFAGTQAQLTKEIDKWTETWF